MSTTDYDPNNVYQRNLGERGKITNLVGESPKPTPRVENKGLKRKSDSGDNIFIQTIGDISSRRRSGGLNDDT